MLNEKETEKILEQFFTECLRYQKTQTKNEREAFKNAIEDIEATSVNPFSPEGKKLNEEAKKKFLEKRKMDLGK